MSSCHYAAKDPRQLKREQVIIQLIIVLNFVMIDEDMFKDKTAAKARFDLSLARSQEKPVRIIYGLLLALLLVFLPWVGGAKPKLWTGFGLHSTMRHYVLASCRTWRKPGSESFLRIHSTCKKWHLKQSKRLNDNHLQAFTWQLSQVTCWDFLGWTRWQVQGKEINQNNTSSHQTFAPMTPNDNGPNRRDTKMRTEMSGTDSGQDSGAKPWRYPWTPLQWAPRQSKPASKWKLPIEKWEISHC